MKLSWQALYSKPWRCHLGDWLKTWVGPIEEDMERLGLRLIYGQRYCIENWVMRMEMDPSRKTWSARIRTIQEAHLSFRRYSCKDKLSFLCVTDNKRWHSLYAVSSTKNPSRSY